MKRTFLILLLSVFSVCANAQAFSQYKMLSDSVYRLDAAYQHGNKYQRDAMLFVDMLADTHPYYVKKERRRELMAKRQGLLEACAKCQSDTAFTSLLCGVLGKLHDKHTDVIDTLTLKGLSQPQPDGPSVSNQALLTSNQGLSTSSQALSDSSQESSTEEELAQQSNAVKGRGTLLMSRHDALFDYTLLEDESICYMQFNQCADARTMRNESLPRFDLFLEEMFHAIDSLQIKTLVVDAQYNNGGSSMLCDELLSHLYPLNDLKLYRSYMRFSDLMASYNPRIAVAKQAWEADGHADELYELPTGQIPALDRKLFGGNVVFVQGPKTFSSAGILMTLVRDNRLGPIIGSKSSYSPSHYGEVLPYRLPNTGVIGSMCCKYFARPDSTCTDEEVLKPTWEIDTDDKEALWKYISFTYGKRLAFAKPLPVGVDERVEFVEAIARVAGYEVFSENHAPHYQYDIDSLFAPYRDEIKAFMTEMRKAYYIGFNSVPSLAVNMEWNGSKFQLMKCEANYMDDRWTKKAVRKMLPFLSDLYRKTDFHAFFDGHKPTYEAAVSSFSDVVASKIDMEWFGRFFQSEADVEHCVLVGLDNGPGNFSVQVHPKGQKHQMISVMGYIERKDGTPSNKPHQHFELTLVHEFCHPYIESPDSLRPVGERLLNKYRQEMKSVGYGTWQNVIEETFVRASVIRYMIDHDYPENVIREEINNQHDLYHFIWMSRELEGYKGNIFQLFDNII